MVLLLETRIALFAGHGFPEPEAEPVWTGTVARFWRDNVELSLDEVKALLDGIEDPLTGHSYFVGGGAAQAFTVVKADAFKAKVPA